MFFVLQIAPVPYPPLFATAADLREHVEAAGHVYRYGTFVQALKFRIEEVRPMGALWLRRFGFGPLEWVWRSFSYGKRV